MSLAFPPDAAVTDGRFPEVEFVVAPGPVARGDRLHAEIAGAGAPGVDVI